MVALIVVAAAAAALLERGVLDGASSIEGSGIAATQTHALPAFRGVDLAAASTLRVRVDREQSVAVRADDNLLGAISTHVQAGVLVVDATDSFSAEAPTRVDVGVPSLEAVTLSGIGRIEVEGVRAERLTVRLAGSGVVRVTGTVQRLDVSIEGSGDAQLSAVAADHVRASVAGAGVIAVDAQRSLDASIQGVGEIVYSGNPARVSTSVRGTGSVHRG